MRQSARTAWLPVVVLAAASLCACQSPTETSETLDVDDFVDSAVNPSPATAVASTDGRTYRVVRGNNQPDEVLPFTFRTTFRVTITLNSNASDDDIDLAFPVSLTSATVKVEQASGGIVTPPTGGEFEHYDSVASQSSGNSFSGTNTNVSITYDIWYTLPSGGKEALITMTFGFEDDDGVTFAKAVKVLVSS